MASHLVLTDQTNLLPAKKVIVVFLALSISLGVVVLEQTITATALPVLSSYFNSGRESIWVATAYLLTSTAFQPSFGRLSDIFGRKILLLAQQSNAAFLSKVEFMLASLACAVAQTMTQLIIFRALQGMHLSTSRQSILILSQLGIGGGAILTTGMIIISDIVDLKNRGKYQGLMECVFAICNGVGPLLGGVFSESVSWRWCFWINIPICAVSLVLIFFCLPLKKVEGMFILKLKTIDYVGTALTLIGSVLMLVTFHHSAGGVEYEWASAPVLVLIFVALAAFAVFCLWEWRFAKLPIVPMYIFAFRTVIGVSVVTTFLGLVWYDVVYFVPQLLQIAKGYSDRAGVLMIPLLACVTCVVFITGQVTARTGIFRAFIIAGFAIWSVATGVLSTIDENSSDSKIMGFLFLCAVGPGLIFQTSLVGLQASVDRKDMAVVTSVRSFLRFLGGTLGLAVSSALINNSIKQEARSINLRDDYLKQVLDDPTAIRHRLADILSPEDQSALIRAYASGFRTVYLVCAGCCAVSFIISAALIQHHDLERGDEKELREETKKWLKDQGASTASKEEKDHDHAAKV
ncbi:MFS general substrate transporter [Atractiella rhizophila]|nr:MFS general substrate transporter [Atractiella rhizophila]